MASLARLGRSPFVLGVVVAGVVGTAMAAAVLHSRAEQDAEEWLSARAEIVERSVLTTVEDFIDGIEAAAAFVELSDTVSQESFVAFAGRIDPRINLIGIAYLPIVTSGEVDDFVASMQTERPGFTITNLDLTGEVIAATERDVYYPVQYFSPGPFLSESLPAGESPLDIGIGVDAASNETWAASMITAFSSDGAIVSDFIPIEYQDVAIGNAFLVIASVHAADGTAIGAVAAPMVDVLLPTGDDAREVAITRDVEWEIISADEAMDADDRGTWTGTIDLPGITWQLRVQPTADARVGLAGTPPWVIWAVGLGLTAAVAGFAQMVRQRALSKTRLTQLQRMAEEKDRFLAAVSHEIRTPLTAVAGLAHELSERPDDFESSEKQTLLATVAEQSDEVAAIVEDLLVAARSDIDKIRIHSSSVDIWSEAEHALESSGVEGRLVGAPTAPAWADPQRVRQILRNLLTNARRYGGPDIELRFAELGNRVYVAVADSGDPIPTGHRERIFAPYTSAHDSGEQVGSIGLGLFISRKLAVLMGGSLGYRHDGRWSRFELILPMDPEANDAPDSSGAVVEGLAGPSSASESAVA